MRFHNISSKDLSVKPENFVRANRMTSMYMFITRLAEEAWILRGQAIVKSHNVCSVTMAYTKCSMFYVAISVMINPRANNGNQAFFFLLKKKAI
jgi:hypothetical protein